MNISAFSTLDDFEFELLHEKYTALYFKIFDNSIPFEKRKLKTLIDDTDIQDKENEHRAVCQFILELLYRSLKDIPLLIYQSMEEYEDFKYGQNRAYMSIIRVYENISKDEPVSSICEKNFKKKLKDCEKKYGLSGEALLSYLKNKKIKIFGKEDISIIDSEMFVQLRELLSSSPDFFFWTNFNHPYPEFILGEIEKRENDNMEYLVFTKEYLRSPSFIINIVAQVYKSSTILRQESFEVIFYNKLVKYFYRSDVQIFQSSRNVLMAFSSGLIKLMLSYLNIHDANELINKKQFLLNLLIEQIVYHEYSHHASYADMKPEHFYFHNFLEEPGSVLLENLADWHNKKGTVTRYLVDLSKQDRNLANAMYYSLMLDYWYPGDNPKESDYLSLATNLKVGLMIAFLTPNGVDFEKIDKEKDAIYNFLLDKYNQLVENLIKLIKSSLFDLGNGKKPMTFSELEKHEFREQKKKSNGMINSLDDFRNSAKYWENILGYLEKFSPSGYKQFQKINEEYSILLENEYLGLITNGNEYNSLRNYIIEQGENLGVIEKKTEIDALSVVTQACKEINLSEEDSNKAIEQCQKIINGQPFQIIDDHHCEKLNNPDPFVHVIQHLLIKGGNQKINSGFPYFDDNYHLLNHEERLNFIKKIVDDITDGFNTNSYQALHNIKINNKYCYLESIIKNIINQTTLDNGQCLSKKIKSIECGDFEDNDNIFLEIYPLLNYGVVDFPSSLSLLLILFELYNNDVPNHYHIDKFLLDFISEAYNKNQKNADKS